MENNSWNPASHSTRPHCDCFRDHDVFVNEVLCELFNSVYDYLPPYEFRNYVINQYKMRWGVCQDIRAAVELSTIQIAKVVMSLTLRNSKNIRISLEGLMWNVLETQRNDNFLWKFVEDKSAPVFQPMWSKIKSNFASGTHLFFHALSKLQPNSKELWSIHRTVGLCLIGKTFKTAMTGTSLLRMLILAGSTVHGE